VMYWPDGDGTAWFVAGKGEISLLFFGLGLHVEVLLLRGNET